MFFKKSNTEFFKQFKCLCYTFLTSNKIINKKWSKHLIYKFFIKIVTLNIFMNCSIQTKWWTGNTKHYCSKAITYYFGLIWKYIVEPEKSKIAAVIFVNIDLQKSILEINTKTRERNLNRISYNSGVKWDPLYKQSFKIGPLSLAEASNTIRIFVVVLSSRITGWCGI